MSYQITVRDGTGSYSCDNLRIRILLLDYISHPAAYILTYLRV